jgi:nucleoside-diphosphate-sugar epimerase
MAASRERILITGAAGFVGACLTRSLIAAGHEVHAIVRPGSNTWRLADVEGQYTRHRIDLLDGSGVRQAVAAGRPECIFHLAAHGAYPGQKDRAAIIAGTLLGTANLLDALAECDYRVLVHTGSSSEYGHKNGPMRPEDRLEPRTDYAVAKAAASLLCQAEAHKGRPVVIVRIFSAYGPWEDPTRLVPYVMECCHRGEPARVSDGWQPRDFIYVGDVVDLLKIAASQPGTHGHILHACTGLQNTVRDMVQTIVSVCGAGRIQPLFGAEAVRPGEPTSWVGSLAETTALTGWTPQHTLQSGIERMWAWYRSAHDLQAA